MTEVKVGDILKKTWSDGYVIGRVIDIEYDTGVELNYQLKVLKTEGRYWSNITNSGDIVILKDKEAILEVL